MFTSRNGPVTAGLKFQPVARETSYFRVFLYPEEPRTKRQKTLRQPQAGRPADITELKTIKEKQNEQL
jgi:hypothetical protein